MCAEIAAIEKDVNTSLIGVIQKHKLTSKQAEAMPLLAFGVDKSIVTSELKIAGTTYDNWIEDPAFLAALTEYRLNLELYHENKLNQAGVLAWERIMEILTEEEPESMAYKDRISLMNLKKDTAKFIIQQLKVIKDESSAKIDFNAKSELHVTDSSADIIARKLHQLQKNSDIPIVDGEYRPVDEDNITNNSVPKIGEKSVPVLDGMRWGELQRKDDQIRCHMCGEYFQDLVSHVLDEHGVDIYGYRAMYGLEEAILTKAPAQ